MTLLGTGKNSEDTVLTFGDFAMDQMPDGTARGTFRSYSVFIDTHDVTLKNLTIENSSGDSITHGQAIALYADGDRLVPDSCRLLGHQDTLFTGPLPPKEKQPGGFIGPKQFAPRINGRHYYKNCYICGDIDFIFGSATAYFDHCTIESLRRFPNDHEIQGYVTAASVYLGRPWREFARTVFLDCSLGPHIHPDGFHDWNKTDARDTVFYAEYRNYPEDESGDDCFKNQCSPFAHRADFVVELDAAQASHFSKQSVLSEDDGWNPS